MDIASKTPLIGPYLADMLRGGPEIGQATISRFFVIHVALLPLLLMGGLGIHLLLIQLHGMSEPVNWSKLPKAERIYEKFFPNFVLKDMMVWLLVLNLLAVFVTLFPWGVGPEADAFAPAPEGIKPEWYFLAMFQFLKLLPPTIGPVEGELCGIMFFGLIGMALATVPFWDTGNNPKASKIATYFGAVTLAGFIFFTIWGFIA